MFCSLLRKRQDTMRSIAHWQAKGLRPAMARSPVVLRWRSVIQGCEFAPSLFFSGASGNKDPLTHAGCVLLSFPRGKSNICLNNACSTSSHPGISHEYYLDMGRLEQSAPPHRWTPINRSLFITVHPLENSLGGCSAVYLLV